MFDLKIIIKITDKIQIIFSRTEEILDDCLNLINFLAMLTCPVFVV